MERFPDEIVDHYDREIDKEQRITQGLGQLELLRTREASVDTSHQLLPSGSSTWAAALGSTPPGSPMMGTTST